MRFHSKMFTKLIVPALTRRPTPTTPLGKKEKSLYSTSSVWWRPLQPRGPGNATSLRSVVLLVVADEAPPVLSRLSLPEEGLSDRLQLGQLETDFLQVEGATVLDLPHGERVHVHKGDIHQLPGDKERKKGTILIYMLCDVATYWIWHPVVPDLFTYFKFLRVFIWRYEQLFQGSVYILLQTHCICINIKIMSYCMWSQIPKQTACYCTLNPGSCVWSI